VVRAHVARRAPVLGRPCYDADVAFTRWDSLRDLLSLHEHLGQLVGTDAPGWTPPVDLYETPREFVLSAELPGLSREQIEIQVEDNRIVIRGARLAASGRDIPCEQYHRVERGHGRFSRAFALPEPIQTDNVTAELKDGVLIVTMPKANDRGVRRINVG
jgi:HSP20 family protein